MLKYSLNGRITEYLALTARNLDSRYDIFFGLDQVQRKRRLLPVVDLVGQQRLEVLDSLRQR